MSKPIVIGFPQSTYVWTARAALAHKGVDYEFRPIGPAESKTPEHLARHPWGKVPAFEHGDVKLYETTAICAYVDAAFDGPALQPKDPAQLARMHQWVSVANSYLYPAGVVRFALQYIFPRGADGAPDRKTIDAALPDIRKTLEVIDTGLGSSPWLCGDAETLADLFVGPLLFVLGMFPEGGKLAEGLQNIARLKEQLTKDAKLMSAAPPAPAA